jgi:hypothetical protein
VWIVLFAARDMMMMMMMIYNSRIIAPLKSDEFLPHHRAPLR